MSQSTVNPSSFDSTQPNKTLWAMLLVSIIAHATVILNWPMVEKEKNQPLINSVSVSLENVAMAKQPQVESTSSGGEQVTQKPAHQNTPEPMQTAPSVSETSTQPSAEFLKQNFEKQTLENPTPPADKFDQSINVEPSKTQLEPKNIEPKQRLIDTMPAQIFEQEQVKTPPENLIPQQPANAVITEPVNKVEDVPISEPSAESAHNKPQTAAVTSVQNIQLDDVPPPTPFSDSKPPENEADYVPAQFQNGVPTIQKPEQAVKRRWKGTVLLRGLVNADGQLSAISVFKSSGHDVLDNAALSQAGTWLFEPARLDGEATAHWVQIPVTFR